MKNKKSEYIRRDHDETQEVTTSLNFTGDLIVKDATAPNQPVTLKQVNEASSTIKNELIAALPITLKPLEKLSFRIEGYNTRNANTGAFVAAIAYYPGFAGITFPTKTGSILVPVGWSWGATEFNGITTYNNFRANIVGIKRIYYAVKDYSATNISATRQISTPETQEDKDYLNNLGYPIIVVHCEAERNIHFGSSANYYDWSCPIFAFKPYGQTFLYTSGQNCVGLLTANYTSVATSYIDFWIENDDYRSIGNFIQNVVGVTFGASFSSSENYGAPGYKFQMFKNNYLEIDQNVENGNGRFYTFVNISENEAYNDFAFSQAFLTAYGAVANINYLQLGFKSRIKYNNSTKTYSVETT